MQTTPIDDLVQTLSKGWRSERLVYRSIVNEDIGFIEKMNSDPVTWAMSGPALFKPQGKESIQGIVDMLKKSLLAVAICLPAGSVEDTTTSTTTTDDAATKDTPAPPPPPAKAEAKPTPIGFVALGFGGGNSLFPMEHHRHTMLGISLDPAYQGKGYGPEAIKWVLDWAFTFGNLHSVGLEVVEYNINGQKAYERIGFVKEGRKREVTFAGGRYWDMLNYSVLAREWMSAKQNREGGICKWD